MDARIVLCPCCDEAVRVNFGENANVALKRHMESQACQRDPGEYAHLAQDEVDEVRGALVCFPYSVHKVLGQSNMQAKQRLEAMTRGMYVSTDIKNALLGTGVKIVELDLEFPVFPKDLEPGSYVFGLRAHMVGVCIADDHTAIVHDNLAADGVGEFRPKSYYRAWKVCFEGDAQVMTNTPTDKHPIQRAVQGAPSAESTQHTEDDQEQQHCFPWSVRKLLRQSNMCAERQLKAMADGPYEIHDVRRALEGTGVKLVGRKLQNPNSLPAGDYILGQIGHVVGVCVREDGGLDVYDKRNPNRIADFSFADYCCAWKLSST